MRPFKPAKLSLQNIDWTQLIILLSKANLLIARYNNYLFSAFAERKVCGNEKNSE